MKPGLYYGQTFEEYLAINAINASGLKEVEKSEAHYWAAYLDPKREIKEPSQAMKLGTAIHTAILEPEKFNGTYAVAPDVDRRTKEGKEAYIAFMKDVGGLKVISSEDRDICKKIQEKIRGHALSETLFSGGKAEVTAVWNDMSTGVLCKARIDYMKDGVIVDLKSIESAAKKDFAKSCANYKWHMQAAWYVDGIFQITGRRHEFIFGAYEKASPWACAFYYCDEAVIGEGRKRIDSAMTKYVLAKEKNLWPSYPEEIVSFTLPKWAVTGTPEAEAF